MAASTIPGRTAPTFGTAAPVPAQARSAAGPETRVASGVGDIVIGAGVQFRGSIGRCASITVHGVLQSDGIHCDSLEIPSGGEVTGVAAAAKAQISGSFHGQLVAEVVVIESSGQVEAEIEYGTLQIERGAKVTGKLQLAK